MKTQVPPLLEHATESEPSAAVMAEPVANNPGGPAMVMVVDDKLMNLKLIEAILKPLGYHVVLAHDGEEGPEKVTGDKPDPVVLPDIMMPHLNGFNVATRLI